MNRVQLALSDFLQPPRAGECYTILEFDDTEDLIAEVNRYIRSGWVTVGGVAVTVRTAEDGTPRWWHMQAMKRSNKA